jgi:transposase-like protein
MPETARSDELTAQQRRAVTLLCSELSLAAVAKQLDINDATLRRWRKRPAFRAALRLALDQTFEDGTRLLTADQLRNLVELVSLRSKADDPAIRLRAALGLEGALARRRELLMIGDLHRRLDDLEAETDDDDETGHRSAAG